MGTVDWLRSLTLIVKYNGIEGKDELCKKIITFN
jgi:hypothetical protein